MTAVLIDTGPLVAFLAEADLHHEWARDQWKSCLPPFYTCEAVLTEAAFLLERERVPTDRLLDLVRRQIVQLDFRLAPEIEAVAGLMQRYRPVPMSVADACLVRMSEMKSETKIFTTDRDFLMYRRHTRQMIPLICPW